MRSCDEPRTSTSLPSLKSTTSSALAEACTKSTGWPGWPRKTTLRGASGQTKKVTTAAAASRPKAGTARRQREGAGVSMPCSFSAKRARAWFRMPLPSRWLPSAFS